MVANSLPANLAMTNRVYVANQPVLRNNANANNK